MAITYISCSPSDGTTDWFVNKSIFVTFSTALKESSLDASTISIIDTSTQIAVDCIVSVSSTDPTVAVITPRNLLRESTAYRLVLVGEDLGLGVQIENQSSERLATTVYVNFNTGNTVYQIDDTVEKDAADKTLEGDLFLPNNLKALGYDFTVVKARPKIHEYDVAPEITGDYRVAFTFSKPLLTGQDYSTWMDVNLYSTLNNDGYMVSGQEFNATIPDYTVGVTGSELYVQFAGALPKNMSATINLTKNITATDGTEYGGEMEYGFITQLYPRIVGVEAIKREIRPIAQFFNDDYIAAIIHKNTMWLWEKVGRRINIATLGFAAVQYVYYSTVLELIEDVDLAKWAKDGVQRRLGDLSVSVATMLGREAIKQARYTKAREVAFETLNKGWQFRAGMTSTAYELAAQEISRLWYNVKNRYVWPAYKFFQKDEPSSNVTVNRWAKTNGPALWW